MSMSIKEILKEENFTKENIISLLQCNQEEQEHLFEYSAKIKDKFVGNNVYLRGLIEYSNNCSKNCFYCGIRGDNELNVKYVMDDDEVLEAAKFALDNDFGSIAIQAGERSDRNFTKKITDLLHKIREISGGELGITLSLGEQSEEVFKEWSDAGAHRYLLRIEASDKDLYSKLHPKDHIYDDRIKNLKLLRKVGYQVGTGVMVGLPWQSYENLADDILFMKSIDIDMCGMGPYIEHRDTPLWEHKDILKPQKERFELTLKMIALLRIIMKDINIVASTAMQTLDPHGREKAIAVGANIIMPNLTPLKYREGYLIYENKPNLNEEIVETKIALEKSLAQVGAQIVYKKWGDSKHFKERNKTK